MKRRILALLLAVVMVTGMFPVAAFAAEAEETVPETVTEPVGETETLPSETQTEATELTEPTAVPTETAPAETAGETSAPTEEETAPVTEPDEIEAYADGFDSSAKVVVSVEGQTIGHGFYLEPTIVSFDEFIAYWAGRGVTVAAEDVTAGGMIDYVVYQNGFTSNGEREPSLEGRMYLSGLDGIRAGKGEAVVPECLADDGVTVEQTPGTDLYQFDYTFEGGWMFSEGNWLSDQSMAGHKFSQFGKLYTVNGQSYYVVRLQFTIAGLGADLGFDDFGTSFGYHAADKSKLYILYAQLAAAGALANNPAGKEAALDVMNKLDATQQEVSDAYAALLSPGQAEKPTFTVNLPTEIKNYPEAGMAADALTVEASVSHGKLSYQWYQSTDRYNWELLDGETEPAYTPATGSAGTTYYRCVVTNENPGQIANHAESAIAGVVVGTLPQAPYFSDNWMTGEPGDLKPTADYALYAANPKPLKVNAYTAYGEGSTLSYQWYIGEAGAQSIDEMTPLEGETSASYTPDVSRESVQVYACRAFSHKDGNHNFADSTLCTVTVKYDVVEISTEEELRAMQLDGNYRLACDITLTGTWTPIDGFCGTLDGNGHTIYGLDSVCVSAYGGGLFGYTMEGATIRNLGIVGKATSNGVNSGDSVAAILGNAYGATTISGCYVNVAVTGNAAYADDGGIVGNADNCTIENCYFTGTVTTISDNAVGGIAGNVGSGVIRNCYTTFGAAFGSGEGENVYGADDIPADMDEFLALLGDAFVPDNGTNDGYPVLYWQGASADKTALLAAIEEAKAINQAAYTVESWNRVSDALKAAQQVADDRFATQQETDDACDALHGAIAALERLPVDKTELEALVNDAKKLDEALYTEESWETFAAALAHAEEILANDEALQSEVIRARKSLEQAIAELQEDQDAVIGAILDSVSRKMTGSGSDWEVTAMAAYGQLDKMDIEAMKADAEKYVFGQSKNATNYERIAISGSAAGIHARSYPRADGTTTDLIAEIANMENLGTVNGYIFALNAYDSGNYTVPAGAKWTRDAVIAYILDAQKADGGWALFGSAGDPDITGMAVTALSRYRDRADVSAALDRALNWMSENQLPNGGYKGAGLWGVENSNSASMIIIALAAMDIDADKDARFVKNGNSVVDALLAYRTPENWFGYKGPEYDASGAMATEQGFRALVAYTNWCKGGDAYYLYDFADTLTTSVVSFRLVGDERHEEAPHDTYMTWIPTTQMEVPKDSTVYDVFAAALEENGLAFGETQPGYIGWIQAPGALGGYELSEFDNGPSSGWMYAVNGEHPGISLRACPAEDGDVIIWHYTDDFTNDDGSWLTVPDTAPVDPERVLVAMYSVFNSDNLEHMFATETELAQLEAAGWETMGISFYSETSGIPVYRMLNLVTGKHYYCINEDERANLVATGNWSEDGILCFTQEGGIPLYDLYNQFDDLHYYSAMEDEIAKLVEEGWIRVGLAWFAAIP